MFSNEPVYIQVRTNKCVHCKMAKLDKIMITGAMEVYILGVTNSALHYVTFSHTPLVRYILDAPHSCQNFHVTRKD
jgi:hypothetical protein